MSAAAIEAVARAIWDSQGPPASWENADPDDRHDVRVAAKAAYLASLRQIRDRHINKVNPKDVGWLDALIAEAESDA